MFGKKHTFADPELGVLTRAKGAWRGEVSLAHGVVRLTVRGPSSGPDLVALELARQANVELERCRSQVEAALADHREPYGTDHGFIRVEPTYVAVVDLDRRLVLEYGLIVPWDDDHTLGARVVDGTLLELNGSVLEP